MFRITACFAPLLALLTLTTPLAAQNLVTNGDFATDLSSWQTLDDGVNFDTEWRDRDASGSPTSGSIRLRHFDTTVTAFTAAVQCVPVTTGETYELAASIQRSLEAPGDGYGAVSLVWFSAAGCSSFISSSPQIRGEEGDVWVRDSLQLVAPPAAKSARVDLVVGRSTPSTGDIAAFIDDVVLAPVASGTGCVPDATTLCIDDSPSDARFRVRVTYDTTQGGGQSGDGRAVPLSPLGIDRGGLFWFFNSTNPEMLVKVLDGCPVNDHYWVFYSAVTNVGFTITVTDTQEDRLWTRTNPDRNAAEPQQDTFAFPCG